jgi:hypothetical protein
LHSGSTDSSAGINARAYIGTNASAYACADTITDLGS